MSLERMQIENCRSFVADLKKILFDLLCRVKDQALLKTLSNI